jgi:hypothetical protein
MRIKWDIERVSLPPDFRNWHYAPCGESTNAEWVCVRDENPSCKHDKLFHGDVDIFPAPRSRDIYRFMRHWICRECFAIGIDAFENTNEEVDNLEIWDLFKRRNEALKDGKFESSEGMDIEFNEVEDK